MPDKRKHRGQHPVDAELFAEQQWVVLRRATADLSWLLSNDYSAVASLKLVGDRFSLAKRQRLAVMRCACSDQSLTRRREKEVSVAQLADQTIRIDGFNLLTTIEAAMSGGIILVGRDGCFRDIASVHGTFRVVEETEPALELIGSTLADLNIARAEWLLDSPVSNSGRLATKMRSVAEQNDWLWTVELVPDPDARLRVDGQIIVTADSVILDHCQRWFNLAKHIVESALPDAVVIEM